MSIASEITRLQNAKAALETSIEAKGVTIPAGTKLDVYHDYVDDIVVPSGDAVVANVLAPKTFSNASGVGLTGTMVLPVNTEITLIASATTLRWLSNTSYTKIKEITVNHSGYYFVRMTLGNGSFASSCYGYIYKNSAPYDTEIFCNNVTTVNREINMFLNAGDKVQLYAREVATGSVYGLYIYLFRSEATINLD